jgi:hypothetical protein
MLIQAERDRCVQADFEQSGILDPEQPQYMDERLGVLDLELAMVLSRISSAEEEIRLGLVVAQGLGSPASADVSKLAMPFARSMTEGDLGMENGITRSFYLNMKTCMNMYVDINM